MNEILEILKDFFKGYLGDCSFCGKRLFSKDPVYGNRALKELACTECYLKEIKPSLDLLSRNERQNLRYDNQA